MAFVKLVKNNAYYKRYQVKFRRRREGKTDFYARKRLVVQDKNKYSTPKYRMVVRRTNAKIICQIVYSTIIGDKVLCQAQSDELKRYGVSGGLTNYAASYCTGLLLARRLLKQVGLEKTYTGVSEVTGEYYDAYEDMENSDKDYKRKPFKAFLDIGLVRTTTGNRVFGALKGACDGGLHVPHSENRFPGGAPKNPEEDEPTEYDPEVHRQHIFGVHIQEYMNKLKSDNAEAYQKQFGKWDKTLKVSGKSSLEELYKACHAAIRKDPDFKKVAKKEHKNERKEQRIYTTGGKNYHHERRLTNEERKERVREKILKAAEGLQ